MGITVNDFFENIYSVIFSPKEFFERKDMQKSIRLAIATLLLIAFINKIAMGIFDKSILNMLFILSLIWHLIVTLILWLLTALFFEYIAKIFDKGGKLKDLLFLTAFAPIPYIFYAPLNLLKHAGSMGYIFSSVTEFFIYIWIIYLYSLALKSVYDITKARAFMMILIPFISSFFAIYWMVCFISKIWYIFSV